MLRATLKSLAARKLRLGMSAFAIVLGVAFVAGSFVFTDTIGKTFKDIFGGLSSDVVVRPTMPEGQDAFAAAMTGASTTTIPAGLVEEIAQVPGVERADGNVESQSVFVLDSKGKAVTTSGAPGIAFNWNEAPSADGSQPVQFVDGRAPERSGELAIDERTFELAGHELGDEVTVITSGDQPSVSGELVGVARFGDGGSLAGASLTIFDTLTAQEIFLDGDDAYTTVSVTAADGVSADDLRADVAEALPSSLEARTGAEVDDETASAVEEALGFFNTFLLVFAAIALFVGVFLILNTFSILLAQRSQEMALFRALGADRRQVTRSVMIEALIVGLVGSTVGLLLGLGVAQLLKVVFGAFGMELGGGLVLAPRTVVVSYLVGVLVTIVAAYVPARRAAKVPPVAAMRDDVVLPESSRRVHGGVGAGLVLLGAGAMAAGLVLDVSNAALLVGVGILGVFVGVALLAPVLSGPIVRVIAGWYPKAFGTVGRLARENALRNPRRTAATASALMIGLALVSAISVVGASANASVDRALDDGMKAQFVIANAAGQPFSPAIADQARAVDGVAEVAQIRAAPATVDGEQSFVMAIDPAAFSQAATLEIVDGTADVSGGGVLVGQRTAESEGLEVGDQLSVGLPAGTTDARVAGIYAEGALLSGGFVLGLDALEQGGIAPVDATVYVVADPSASPARVESGLQEITAELPTVTVKDQEAYKEQSRNSINQLLSLVYALLGLAVLIAVLGIVNTLALSVMERTREVGLLRAVGLSRRQLRTTIRLESIAIAVLGAVMGVVLGVVFGVSLQRPLADDGLEVLSIPYASLGAFVLVAALVGVLAAVWPARRAARLDVLRAITTE